MGRHQPGLAVGDDGPEAQPVDLRLEHFQPVFLEPPGDVQAKFVFRRELINFQNRFEDLRPCRTRSRRPSLNFAHRRWLVGVASVTHEEVGPLSTDRWGPGSLLTIGAFLTAGSILLVRWVGTKGWFSLLIAVLLLGGGAVMFVVKVTENIERVEFRGYDPVGKVGVITAPISGRSRGSVRVDGLDWSATSDGNVGIGEEVVVVSRDGLHVSVRRHQRPLPT